MLRTLGVAVGITQMKSELIMKSIVQDSIVKLNLLLKVDTFESAIFAL